MHGRFHMIDSIETIHKVFYMASLKNLHAIFQGYTCILQFGEEKLDKK